MASSAHSPGQETPSRTLVFIVLAILAITPVLIALAGLNGRSSWWPLGAGTVGWLVLVVAYHVLMTARQRRERADLLRELVDTTDAHRYALNSLQDRLREQGATLGRIIALSSSILEDGITDPRMTLDNVHLLGSHAHDAMALVEDTVTGLRIEADEASMELGHVDARTQIEQVVSRIHFPGISTSGPRCYTYTDAALFRVLVRSLVTAAIGRDAEEIDVSVARNGSGVVCTVSDNGPEHADPPPLAAAVAGSLDAEIVVSHRFKRNHFGVELPVAPQPCESDVESSPLDVVGSRRPDPTARAAVTNRLAVEPVGPAEPIRRDENQTVAARRKSELIAR